MIGSFDASPLAERNTGILNRIKRAFKEYGYLFIAFAVPVVIMYAIYLAMEIHPFGNGSVLVLDLNGQYVDFYEALRHFIYGDASLLYSFSRALGGEFMGMYAYYLASPFSYIIALFPQDMILDALLVVFLIKTGMCAVTFGFYLHRTSSFGKNFSKINVVTFSIMYALCAYCVVQQHNSMWIDAVMWLPLITYGIEELIKKGHYKLYTVSLAICLMSNFYIGFMTCIYTAIYFFVYYFMHNEKNRNNPFAEKAHLAKSFLRIVFFSVLALAIAAVILLTAYYSLTFGKTDFSSASWDFEMRFDLIDIFAKFLPCSYDTVRPEGLPFVYCGVLTLLLVPVYFCSSRFSVRERILSAVLIGIFLLSFVINPIDIIWHGFQKPNWLNYRYSFMLCFILLVLAYKGITEIKRSGSRVLVSVSAALFALLALAQKTEFSTFILGGGTNDRNHEVGKLLDIECIWFTAALVAVYLIILGVMKYSKRPQNIALVLAVIVSVEVFCNGLCNCLDLGADVIYTSYSTYTDYISQLRGMTDKIQTEDKSFYRMDELTHRKVNDNMAVNAHGLTNSTSTLNATTIKFLQNMGYFAKSHEAQYFGGNVVSDSLLGIKYTLKKATSTSSEVQLISQLLEDENFYSSFMSDENYLAYRNEFALSLAYAVNSNINNIDMADYLNPYDRLNAIITAMLGESETVEVFKEMEIIETVTSGCTEGAVRQPYDTGNYDYPFIQYDATDGSSGTLEYVAKLPETDNESKAHYVYFYLPSEFQRAFTLRSGSTNYGSVFGNSTMRAIPLGPYYESQFVSAELTLEANVLYVTQGVGIFYYLDEDVFEDAMAKLSQSQLIIDEGYSDDHLTGTINTLSSDQMIFTSIPYDEGWQVYVDGQKVVLHGILGDSSHENETAGALIAFNISEAGEHTVELKYRPRAFTLGLLLTVIGSVAFILIVIFEKKVNRFADKILCPIIIPMNGETCDADLSSDSVSLTDELISADPPEQSELEETETAKPLENADKYNGGN